jgi:D-inositol-3-phosphate glycosyltransferase
VTPEFGAYGGTTTVTRWLYDSLAGDSRFEPYVVSVATSSHDEASARLLDPRTWARGPVAFVRNVNGIRCTHIGARWCELEPQRYRSRRVLNHVLDGADVIQIVAGSPAWGLLASGCRATSVLQVATLSKWERASRVSSEGPGPAKAWRKLMSQITAELDMKGLRAVDKVMVENRRMYDLVAAVRSPEDVCYAPPGVDVDLFSPLPVRNERGPILTVGRLSDPRKNIRGLLEAYARLRTRKHDLPGLWLVGQELRTSDRDLARSLRIDDHLRVTPELSQEDLVSAYRSAGIFVLPSNEEGFGLVILEAMASGLPVVATKCGGPETIVRDGTTGYLIDVGDVEGLTAALERLIDDPLLASRFGSRGRSIAVNEYSRLDRASQFLTLYQAVCATNGKYR